MTPLDSLKTFLKLESASGILLMIAAAAAMAVANSPAQALYQALFEVPVEVRIGALQIAKPLLLWINDGLMAVFFLLVGLELKREVLEGNLSDPSQIALPAVAALGGMLLPAGSMPFATGVTPSRSAAGRSPPRPTLHSRSACWPWSAAGCRSG